jgi:DNA-binding transcriptional ArsR family regulator
MSVAAMSWAFGLKLRSTEKLVLLALADHANDAGSCWPSNARIMEMTGLSDGAVRGALRALKAAGVVRAEARRGTSNVYALMQDQAPPAEPESLPDNVVPMPARVAARARGGGSTCQGGWQDMPGGMAAGATPGGSTCHLTVSEPSEKHQGSGEGRERRATRLPADWRPTDRDRAFAVARGLDPDTLAEGFRDYWRAKPKANTSLDWSANWRTWCGREVQWAAKGRGPARQAAQPSKLAWMAEAMGRTAAAPAPSFDYEGAAEVMA